MNPVPKFATLTTACHLLGLGRTKVYELAALGDLRLIKAGGRTLVDVEHALDWMTAQPPARLSAPKKRSA